MDEEFSSALLTGCVLLASRCWALPRKTCRTIRPPHADQPAAEGKPRCAPAPYRRTILACTRPNPGRPRGRADHCPTTSRRRRPGPNRRLGWPSSACASFETRRRLRQTTSQAWTQRATTPTPAIPAIRRPAHAALQDLTSAGHSGRGNEQTPDAHTGRRTADTWTLRRPHRTLNSGPVDRQAWTLVARTGHRTLDTGRWPRTWTG